MNEKVKNELTKAAQLLSLPFEEIENKWKEIVSQNELNPEVEIDCNLGLALFRQWFAQQKRAQQSNDSPSSDSNIKVGFGFAFATDDCRDWEQTKRDKLMAEYLRNKDEIYNAGQFAYVDLDGNNYIISQVLNGAEVKRSTASITNFELPNSVMEIDGRTILPLDDRKTLPWGGDNPNHGHPRNLNDFQRTIHFIGEVENGGVRHWSIKAKEEMAQNWDVDSFRWVSIRGIWNNERNRMYPVSNYDGTTTLNTIMYNDTSDEAKDMSETKMQDVLVNNLKKFVSPLMQLEEYHSRNQNAPFDERIVITDGNVVNMNMSPNSTGNRTISISDLNVDYDYDSDSYSSTPCWTPPHINVDFGIGSHVLIIGRSSQSVNQETGQLRQPSINVSGIYVLDKRGNPVEFKDSGEINKGWF